MRTPYTQLQRDEALAALMASAVEKDGEMVPVWSAVEKVTGISIKSLMRWWRERDPARDAELRRVHDVARSEAIERGSRAWVRNNRTKVMELLDSQLAREDWSAVSPDRATKALAHSMDLIDRVERAMPDQSGEDLDPFTPDGEAAIDRILDKLPTHFLSRAIDRRTTVDNGEDSA